MDVCWNVNKSGGELEDDSGVGVDNESRLKNVAGKRIVYYYGVPCLKSCGTVPLNNHCQYSLKYRDCLHGNRQSSSTIF